MTLSGVRNRMRQIEIGGVTESIVEAGDYPPERIREVLGGETLAVLGYGVQGRNQSLNLRDRGLNVVVGLRPESRHWPTAVDDGWHPGTTLFPLVEAAQRGSIVLFLLSDAGQMQQWPAIQPALTSGKALVFAHGFAIVYGDQTGVVPPADVDVLLVAPRGSGTTLRRNFQAGTGLSGSIDVRQNASGRGRVRAEALGIAIGLSSLFETTFENEVICDLTGERGTLLGAIYGLWLAQYEVLREHGHSPAEAFNETVEEATQSLYPLIAENGIDWMYEHCSTTAQRGALDWFRRFRDAVKPLFEELYGRVADGSETRRVLEANSQPDYQKRLAAELRSIADSEMWRAGALIRSLRPAPAKAEARQRR
jgi:ketol-acid reductoisomerase